ncbi:hypothetical protein ACHAWF_012148 [Thalassiosira exigua]
MPDPMRQGDAAPLAPAAEIRLGCGPGPIGGRDKVDQAAQSGALGGRGFPAPSVRSSGDVVTQDRFEFAAAAAAAASRRRGLCSRYRRSPAPTDLAPRTASPWAGATSRSDPSREDNCGERLARLPRSCPSLDG